MKRNLNEILENQLDASHPIYILDTDFDAPEDYELVCINQDELADAA